MNDIAWCARCRTLRQFGYGAATVRYTGRSWGVAELHPARRACDACGEVYAWPVSLCPRFERGSRWGRV